MVGSVVTWAMVGFLLYACAGERLGASVRVMCVLHVLQSAFLEVQLLLPAVGMRLPHPLTHAAMRAHRQGEAWIRMLMCPDTRCSARPTRGYGCSVAGDAHTSITPRYALLTRAAHPSARLPS